jgi:hypothetical protein
LVFNKPAFGFCWSPCHEILRYNLSLATKSIL